MSRFTFLILLVLFIFGFWLRHQNIQPANLVFDFDQYEDMFYTYKIAVDHDPVIIGRAIYGDARIHHGVFYYYYNLIPFLISNGDLFISAYWNSFFNAASLIIIFILAKFLFGKILPGVIAATIAAVSFEFIKFSNWLTIDTVAIFLLPLFYLGLISYLKGKNWGLILSSISLGLSLQTDLSFLYLLGIFLIFWVIFKPKLPDVKLFLITLSVFIFSISTLILTEIKLNFSGIKTLLNFSSTFEAARLPLPERITLFIQDFGKQFSLNLFPQRADLGIYLAVIILLSTISPLFLSKTSKGEKQSIYFLLLYLLSPAITLLLGYHQKPWFLSGLPPAIALICGYVISRLKPAYLILPLLLLIVWGNSKIILERPNKSYQLFDNIYDSTSDLDYQLKVVDYTYRMSNGQPFAINAVTYPLYYNGMWAYLYNWYGKSHYDFSPSWLGGDQLHPYDLLPKATGEEKIIYMIISETIRIPDVYKNKGRAWAMEQGRLIEEKVLDGFTILKIEPNEKL